MKELKRCAHCGGEAKTNSGVRRQGNFCMAGNEVFCTKCNLTTDLYTTMKEAIAAWNTRLDGWIKITNGPATLPKCNNYYIVKRNGGGDKWVGEAFYRCETKKFTTSSTDSDEWGGVTHWQPLPELPNDQ